MGLEHDAGLAPDCGCEFSMATAARGFMWVGGTWRQPTPDDIQAADAAGDTEYASRMMRQHNRAVAAAEAAAAKSSTP